MADRRSRSSRPFPDGLLLVALLVSAVGSARLAASIVAADAQSQSGGARLEIYFGRQRRRGVGPSGGPPTEPSVVAGELIGENPPPFLLAPFCADVIIAASFSVPGGGS
jgi:hypothetical protein